MTTSAATIFILLLLHLLVFIRHQRVVAAAGKQGYAYRHMKFRLRKMLDKWAVADYVCNICEKSFPHTLDCPYMAVRSTLRNAELEEK